MTLSGNLCAFFVTVGFYYAFANSGQDPDDNSTNIIDADDNSTNISGVDDYFPRETTFSSARTVHTTSTITAQELRKKCCNESDYSSYCTVKKCYFLVEEESSFLTSRNYCAKDYAKWERLADAATIEEIEELESVKEFLAGEGKVWIGAIRCVAAAPPTSETTRLDCPSYQDDYSTDWPSKQKNETCYSMRWLNGKPVDWDVLPHPVEVSSEGCAFATLEVSKDQPFSFVSEEMRLKILCQLEVPDQTGTTTTELVEDTTISTSTESELFETWCENRTYEGIEWPRTRGGRNAIVDCPQGTIGKATWDCDVDTGMFISEPDLMGCKSEWLMEIEDELSAGGDPSDIARKLAEKTKQVELIYGDLSFVIDAVALLNKRYRELSDLGRRSYGNATVYVGSNLLDERHKVSWEKLVKGTRVRKASKLLFQIQTIGSILSCKDGGHLQEESIRSSNILFQSFIFETVSEKSTNVFPKAANGTDFLRVPSSVTVDHSSQRCSSLPTGYGILYDRISSYLLDQQKPKRKVISKVISFAYGNGTRSVNLPPGKEVLVSLKHRLVNETEKLSCVFWNFTERQWDDTGCWKVGGNDTHTQCKCSHLTNFAVLMDLDGGIRRSNDLVMKYLSIVCCALSSLALSFTIACLIGFRASHSRRNTITCNLSFCLLAVNLLVLFGIKRTGSEIACRIIAALLHYSALASFCWMLLEGYHLYQMVIVVFEKANALKLRWFCIFAYGFPLLIVLPTVIASPKSYGDENACWLSAHDNIIWTFSGPIAAILLVNTTILIMALHSAYNVKMKREQTRARNLLGWLKGSFSLMTLLGITWIIGFVNVYKSVPALVYAFIILNGLQGCFIMVFHVIINEKVRGCLMAFVRRSPVSEAKFRKSMQTTTSSRNPLYAGRSSESTKDSPMYRSGPRRISVSPASITYTGHM